MALISMCCYDTPENGKTWMTKKTLESIERTTDLTKHRLVIIDQNSVSETRKTIKSFCRRHSNALAIYLPENIGTARGINKAIEARANDEYFIKMDNDVVFGRECWADAMELVMQREPNLGILGLKRKDCIEHPRNKNPFYKSELRMAYKQPDEQWNVIELVKHVMGTCQMFSPALLISLGYMYQMEGLYGYDDVLMSLRSELAGYLNAFLHGYPIEHIDVETTEYAKWKLGYAQQMGPRYSRVKKEFESGERPVYCGPQDK